MLRALIVGLFVVIALIFIFVVFDIAVCTLDFARDEMATALNVSNGNRFSQVADSAVNSVAWIAPLAVAGAILVYAIHVRRR